MPCTSEKSGILEFDAVGRLPFPGDNAAIAVRDLPAGTAFRYGSDVYRLTCGVLEGHRFAVASIDAGDFLLSWNLPFGKALRRIEPGDYLCNAGVLSALRLRNTGMELPPIANFQNAAAEYVLDENAYAPGTQVASAEHPATFPGYERHPSRGVGTRNVIVLIATTSSSASFARLLEGELAGDADRLPNVDAIVAVAHTEGAGESAPNNAEIVLRTLAGFLVHANVAAALAIDTGTDYLNNGRLRDFLATHDYPLQHVPHRFHTLQQDIGESLAECSKLVRGLYAEADAARRTPQPVSALKVALQCGGSDAFSGISGNPLAGWVAKEVIRHGGTASLAETDELIGAERYILANTRDLETVRRFLAKVAAFRERIAWHGHSAEGNPSGGNLFRGLYNISLKSIGAARKKDPDVRLDYVVDYAERMQHPGFHFMDSPGNDLESIAGQVASGCNLIFFITGNGSITNFPFVPTIKFVTTTARWNLLARDMDVNAGRFQDGEAIADIGAGMFDHTIEIASGTRSAGERAAHSQVSIWRNWYQTDGSRLDALLSTAAPDGNPVAIGGTIRGERGHGALLRTTGDGRVGLIVPTSLCSGQIALRIAGELNARQPTLAGGMTRYVALPHTEGCGASSGENEDHFLRTLVGHLMHPAVGAALLLEHGCERTHNDLVRHTLRQYGVDPDRFGYASIQLDGGIDKVTTRVVQWFADQAATARRRPTATARPLAIGLTASGPVPAGAAEGLAALVSCSIGDGGTVVIPRTASLLNSDPFLQALAWAGVPAESLAYGQRASHAGCHIMATPGANFVESLTGLGGTGVDVILAHVDAAAMQGHPMIPTIQVSSASAACEPFAADLDLVFDDECLDAEALCDAAIARIAETSDGNYEPRAWSIGLTDFQLTRGLLGVSL
jgi:altronate dehydratase